jgi:hypothetical protein
MIGFMVSATHLDIHASRYSGRYFRHGSRCPEIGR